jgi:alkylation response protein AidB-like acyl-CoA dehydrogenase
LPAVGAGVAEVQAEVGKVAARWREDRSARQSRRHLEQADFDELRSTGLLTLCAPVDDGGLWQSPAASIRDLCAAYRTLASADPSVALVSSMHPAVVAFWLALPDPGRPEWETQRRAVFASAARGEQWATITSEPGSGGDIARTRSVATPIDDEAALPGRTYAVTGDKHFGSGSGVVDHMMTTAIPEGEDDPTIFVLHVRDRPWDGSAGLRLVAEWDGMGMAATQSHAMRL